MGRSSKRKGGHYERRVVEQHQDAGIVCRRVPLSGAVEGYPSDVVVADHFRGEVKARKRASGFKQVRDWLADNDMLFLQEIGAGGPHGASPPPLVVLPWERYIELLHAWGQQEDQP